MNGQNGKGSKNRSDPKKFREGWERAFETQQNTNPKKVVYCSRCGQRSDRGMIQLCRLCTERIRATIKVDRQEK